MLTPPGAGRIRFVRSRSIACSDLRAWNRPVSTTSVRTAPNAFGTTSRCRNCASGLFASTKTTMHGSSVSRPRIILLPIPTPTTFARAKIAASFAAFAARASSAGIAHSFRSNALISRRPSPNLPPAVVPATRTTMFETKPRKIPIPKYARRSRAYRKDIMLTPKTIAMNAANAPHWTLYRRTANRRNQPRTIPMRMRPSWLMSMAFPRRMGEIPRIPDKGVGAVLTRNNEAGLGKPATRLNYPRATCPAGVALVRLDRLSGVRDHERFDELLLRELRDRPRDRRHGGTCRARGRSATPWSAPDRAISGRIPVLSAPIPAERDVLGHAIRPVRRMDEELPAILRRVLGPGRRDRCAFRRPFVRHSRDCLRRRGFRWPRSDVAPDLELRSPSPLRRRGVRLLCHPHEHRHRRHDGIRGPPVSGRTDDGEASPPPGTHAVPQHPGRKHPARAHPVRPRHAPVAPHPRRPASWTARCHGHDCASVRGPGTLRRPGRGGDLPLRVLGPLRSRDHDGERERGRWPLEELADEPRPPLVPVRRDPHRVHPRGRHRHRDLGPPRFRLLGGRSRRVRLRVRPLLGPDQRRRRFVDRHPRRGRVCINRPPPDAFLRRRSPVPGRTRNRAAAGSRANRFASSFGSTSGPMRS